MKEPYENIKVRDMIRVIERMGYRRDRRRKASHWWFHPDGGQITMPDDPEEVMYPTVVNLVLCRMRLPEKDFERLLKEP
jgi:predicted RNA binding protein YcfA (HicA-like mRNA interferase family)